MSNKYTQKMVCPYCEYEFKDSRKYDNCDGEIINCIKCEEPFNLTVDIKVIYNTHRIDCANDKHQWEEPWYVDYDQEWCDERNAEAWLKRIDWEPHRIWMRKCVNCNGYDYTKVEIGGSCPWKERGV